MLKDKLIEQLNNENHYTVPKYVLSYAKELSLDMNSLILLIYFMNQKKHDIFDYKRIMKDMNFNEEELLDSISILKDKKILSIEMHKNETGILEERININSFYDIVFSKILNEKEEIKSDESLYDSFEKEFGRTLSPMEYEIIGNWIESKISKELILEALRETVFNGVNNLRYVDKILYEWNKKGIKKPEDVHKNCKKEEEEKPTNCYEYDWLNE
ncbi:MAG: DnaD domain protein [Bacilli bacterium]